MEHTSRAAVGQSRAPGHRHTHPLTPSARPALTNIRVNSSLYYRELAGQKSFDLSFFENEIKKSVKGKVWRFALWHLNIGSSSRISISRNLYFCIRPYKYRIIETPNEWLFCQIGHDIRKVRLIFFYFFFCGKNLSIWYRVREDDCSLIKYIF